ncbi:MAG TPA: TolC family protein [Caulobacteraceae bacterium]|nr:TolC family protein [Caulobacteraceae bacterium]
MAGLAAIVLAGCAHFTPLPLAQRPDLAGGVGQLSADVSQIRLAPLPARPIDPMRLTPTDAAILAVLNSPDLNAKRAATGVAAAQAFAAGLLPDPQLTPVSMDFPEHPKGLVPAWNLTPTIDIVALITRGAAHEAAEQAERQANLDLLWSEWSTAQKARQLALTALMDEAKAKVLAAIDTDLAERARQSGLASERHDVTAAIAGADLAAKLDADVQLRDTERAAVTARAQLNAVIGLDPSVRLPLVDEAGPHDPTASAISTALADLSRRRPDLLALQAGYASQNANLRKAILAQFPVLNLGYSRQRDTGAILTNGWTANIDIPIFNGNRGNIAIERATRAKLAQEYQARIDQTAAEVDQARRDLADELAEQRRLETQVPILEQQARSARPALARGDLDSAAYLAIEESALKEVATLWDTRLARRVADIGLETVLFTPPPEVSAR